MNIIYSIILGIVEGVTEFLPISSTAHLIIASKILGIPQTDFQKFFEVFIQSGAIFAIIFLYFQYVAKHKKVLKNALISFIPTAIIGLILRGVIKKYFFGSMPLIAGALILFGIVFIIIEYLIKQKKLKLSKKIDTITMNHAVAIGLAQSLAVVPGVSRSGIVIIAMLLFGYERDDAAIYSFLLAVPTIFAASALDLIKSKDLLMNAGGNMLYLIIGFVVSFITAYVSVKWLVDYLKKNSLTAFGIYRILLGIIVLPGFI